VLQNALKAYEMGDVKGAAALIAAFFQVQVEGFIKGEYQGGGLSSNIVPAILEAVCKQSLRQTGSQTVRRFALRLGANLPVLSYIVKLGNLLATGIDINKILEDGALLRGLYERGA